MSYNLLQMLGAFQKRFHCTPAYVLDHAPKHLAEEVEELRQAIEALQKKCEENDINFTLFDPNTNPAETVLLANELTDIVDAVTDITFLSTGVWNVLHLTAEDQDKCNQIVTECNLAKVYAPSHVKRAIKMPLWEPPEPKLKEVILSRAKANSHQEPAEEWTAERIENETIRIGIIKDKCGPTECDSPQYIALRVQYISDATGQSNGKQEYYALSKPKTGCYKEQGLPCPKKCDFKQAPGLRLLAKAISEFKVEEGEHVTLQLALFGYKTMPEKIYAAFRQMNAAVQAKGMSVVLLKTPPEKVKENALFTQTMANLQGQILASFPVQRSTLDQIRELIQQDLKEHYHD